MDGSQRLDLYIDESGSGEIYNPKYKFFVIGAVTLPPTEKDLISSLFRKWRNKYLRKPTRCFHATDFFEDYKPGYKNKELRFDRNFNIAVDELIEILRYPDFKAQAFYAKLSPLRGKFSLSEPPPYRDIFQNKTDEKTYDQEQEAYKKSVVKTIGKRKFEPLALTLKKAFSFHFGQLNSSSNPKKGYINFESLSGADTVLIEQYHKLKSKIDQTYEEKIIGIDFHTKNSLEGGIELADLISYISFQSLRGRTLKTECPNLSDNSIDRIREFRQIMRDDYAIRLIDVTNDTL